jgi:hypothetical protein
MLEKPAVTEYPEYFQNYTKLLPDGDVLAILEQQMDSTLELIEKIGEDRAGHRYAPDKWSIKEVFGHVVDIERVFAFRALVFGRGDTTPLPGVEQDDLVAGGDFDSRSLQSIGEEFWHQRESNITLFKSFGKEAWMRIGSASGYELTVRSIPYIMAGHERHHVGVIRDRYL